MVRIVSFSKPLTIHRLKHKYRRYRGSLLKWQVGIFMVTLTLITMCSQAMQHESVVSFRRYLVEDVGNNNLTDVPATLDCNITVQVYNPNSYSIGEFPDDVFTNDERRNGAIFLHVICMIYMFSALAIVCDSFFEASLEGIVREFKISNDVAGATWMAAGGSAPEFATSLIGALVTKSDIGFGTIVGSAVFNVLFVIGACAFVVGEGLKLTPYPLARDSSWYTCCLIAVTVVVADQKVMPYEAGGLLGMYVIYIAIMKFNSRLEVWFNEFFTTKYKVGPASTSTTEEDTLKKDKPDGEEKEEEEDDDDGHILAFPDDTGGKIMHACLLPLKAFMYATIPDCNAKPKLYMVTFVMCVLHITVYSYVMVMMASAIGVTAGIPAEVMGVTVLAMGTSIPDALSSIAVAKHGFGDMAVSSSIGSNVFDVTMGLPLPWLLYSLKTTLEDKGEDVFVVIHSKTMYLSVGTLLLMLISTVVSIHWNKWILNTRLGFMLMALYAVFFIETLVLFFVEQNSDCSV